MSTRNRLAVACVLMCAWAGVISASGLQANVSEDGQVTLSADGLLGLQVARKPPAIGAFVMQGDDGLVRVKSEGDPAPTFDAASSTWQAAASWGTVRMTVKPATGGLDLVVEITAADGQMVDRLSGNLLWLSSETAPKGKGGTVTGIDEPTVSVLDLEAGKLAVLRTDTGVPVKFGLRANDKPDANGRTGVVLEVDTDVNEDRDQPPVLTADKPLTVSLRLTAAGPDAGLRDVAPQQVADFLKANPFTMNWPDRRPIGRVFMASTAAQHKSPTNPRGWFNNPKIDITTAQGLDEFNRQLLTRAENIIRICRKYDAQGAIIWDIEGGEFPHATTFVGDPRRLPDFAPEMDQYADGFFKAIRDGGLRVGVCIRPSILHLDVDPDTGERKARHGNMGFDMGQNIIDKIAYCKKRWGVSMFYMDTNVEWYWNRKGKPEARLLPTAMMRRITEAHPDVLIIPEFMRPAYYGMVGGYGELRSHGFGNVTGTPDWIRDLYPNAMRVVVLEGGDIEGKRDILVRNIARGDVLFLDAWWDPKHNQHVADLYQAAASPQD